MKIRRSRGRKEELVETVALLCGFGRASARSHFQTPFRSFPHFNIFKYYISAYLVPCFASDSQSARCYTKLFLIRIVKPSTCPRPRPADGVVNASGSRYWFQLEHNCIVVNFWRREGLWRCWNRFFDANPDRPHSLGVRPYFPHRRGEGRRMDSSSQEEAEGPRRFSTWSPELSDLIKETILSFIRHHSPLAEKSREKEETVAPGVTAADINKHLLRNCPWITIRYPKGFSEDVIRHLLSAPNKGRLSMEQYRGEIKTKLAGGQNNKVENHPRVRFLYFHA